MLDPYLTLTQPLNEALAWTTQRLNKLGLKVEQTFDLQVARASHVGCPCPHHGTDQCSCQMVILLILDDEEELKTMVLHGNDDRTDLSLVNIPGKHSNGRLDESIRLALVSSDEKNVTNPLYKGMNNRATAVTRARYDRIAPLYDLMPMQVMVGRMSRPWREKMWQMAENSRVLEVGVGTGINIELWPSSAQVTAVDLSPQMLEQARKRADQLGRRADLRLGDVQCLCFPDASFDVAIATFLFCSVPDPVLGLREMGRVVRPGGSILLLEHMLSPNPYLAAMMNAMNPLAVRMMGANINRRTLRNILAAGLHIEQVENLDSTHIFRMVRARSS